MLSKLFNRFQKAYQVFLHGRYPPPDVDQMPKLKPENLAEIYQFFNMPKFFIFGHARSGTTMLARLIRVHPEVHCNWQAHFFTRPPFIQALVSQPEIQDWLSQPGFRWNRGRDLTPQVLRVMMDYIMEREAKEQGKTIVGDKSPNSYLPARSVESLHHLYPDGKLIFIIRDGRDVVLSHRIQTFIDHPEYLSDEDLRIRENFSTNPMPFYEGHRSLFTEQWLKKDIQSWVRNVNETTSKGKALFGSQFLSIKFEDLLAQPHQHLAELWSFLEVQNQRIDLAGAIEKELDRNPDAQWQKEQDEKLVDNLEKGKTGSWKDLFTPQDVHIVKEIAGETLIAWNYEEDLAW